MAPDKTVDVQLLNSAGPDLSEIAFIQPEGNVGKHAHRKARRHRPPALRNC